jgi:hypothetical protein
VQGFMVRPPFSSNNIRRGILHALLGCFAVVVNPLSALTALSQELRCSVLFLEAFAKAPAQADATKKYTGQTAEIRAALQRNPLSSYSYFQLLHEAEWHMTRRKPVRHEFPFLARYELTYLEASLNRHGLPLYRFEHKVGHRNGMEFIWNPLDPAGIFIQHAVTRDQFLHLTCVPE